jgi:hypothetical protein
MSSNHCYGHYFICRYLSSQNSGTEFISYLCSSRGNICLVRKHSYKEAVDEQNSDRPEGCGQVERRENSDTWWKVIKSTIIK